MEFYLLRLIMFEVFFVSFISGKFPIDFVKSNFEKNEICFKTVSSLNLMNLYNFVEHWTYPQLSCQIYLKRICSIVQCVNLCY